MALTLQKGGNLSLTKTDPGLKKVTVGLGWDVRTTAGEDFDLDASALLLTDARKVRSNEDFVFYNQVADKTVNEGKQAAPGASVVYGGDNRTGAGDGDDETIDIDLDSVPADVATVAITASIYAPPSVTFGQVNNAYIRVVNAETGEEIVRYDLNEDYSVETALVFGEVYRKDNEWKFKAVGQGYSNGLAGIANDFGVVGLS